MGNGIPKHIAVQHTVENGIPKHIAVQHTVGNGFPKTHYTVVLLKQLYTDQSAVIRWNNILKYLSSNTSAKPCTTNTLASVGSYDLDQLKII